LGDRYAVQVWCIIYSAFHSAPSRGKIASLITTDHYPATELAIAEEIYLGDLSVLTQHRMVKYLNSIVEQDHLLIKCVLKPKLGLQNFNSATALISGLEIMPMLRQQQAGQMSSQEEAAFIHRVMMAAKGLGDVSISLSVIVPSLFLHQDPYTE
jgi:hypothetical protein